MGVKNRLKEIRLKEYMIDSKTEFAKKLNINVHTYIKWENGDSVPVLEKALEVAKQLNKRVDDIWYLE
ncbi:helix-turn-helix transcriptional regulator [Caloranaerobacter ferrireducens]|uniref:helix-turn-helix transcriptional regulator n=1 Tax=Caloranaerobacter ferrireducens TaxID=1323370 RepID=UPI00084D05B4|nr:helix-turn-helix domain-containing protein [Caloranaerobacter ferrireducens]